MEEMDRLERLVAVLLVETMREAKQIDQIVALKRAGLTNVEIADILGTSSGVVAQSLYAARNLPRAPSTRKRARRRTKG